MKVINLTYDWFISNDGEQSGEDYSEAEIGCKLWGYASKIFNIEEHRSRGEGDRWYYDIYLEDGTIIRTFNPNKVVYAKEDK